MNNRKKLKLMSLVGYAAALVGAAGYIEGCRIEFRGACLSEKQIYAPAIDDGTFRNVDRIQQLEKSLAKISKDGREEPISNVSLIRELSLNNPQRKEFEEYRELISNSTNYNELLRRGRPNEFNCAPLGAVSTCPVLLVGGLFYGFVCRERAKEAVERK